MNTGKLLRPSIALGCRTPDPLKRDKNCYLLMTKTVNLQCTIDIPPFDASGQAFECDGEGAGAADKKSILCGRSGGALSSFKTLNFPRQLIA
jgi:hypothetical protein